MSGHSKWSKIKRKKGAEDAKRSVIFSKLIREIHAAARQGGGDENMNPRLRTVLDKARAVNMPADNIKRALAKAEAGADGAEYVEMLYEGFGPEGVAILVESLTDNKNRTVADLRHIFNKNNGTLGDSGCVAYLFTRVGQCTVPPGKDRDAAELALMEAGAMDIEEGEEGLDVTVAVEDFEAFKKAMDAAGMKMQDAELAYQANTSLTLAPAAAEKVLRLVDALEDNEDVQAVWANFESAEE